MPSVEDRTQKVEQNSAPHEENGEWFIGWTVSNKTSDEVQDYDDRAAASGRARRDDLLAQSDWTQVADAPVDATLWATYRQALRDITDHVNFPYLDDADWPTKP